MKIPSYRISESGYIYLRTRRGTSGIRRRRSLGHISELLAEQSTLGESVKRWWERYLSRIGAHRTAADTQ